MKISLLSKAFLIILLIIPTISFADSDKIFSASADSLLPYILRCKYLGAYKTVFISTHRYREDYSQPYPKDEIIWPDQIRQIGDDFMKIADIWCKQLDNAFNIE